MSSIDNGLALEAQTATPIAQLDPSLSDIPTRAISGIITLVWPYNSSTNSLAFNLAEPDARLRRTKGNVRIQLHGSSAKAVAAMKLGGGDMVTIGLDGVEWVKDSSSTPGPASRLEWQLQYTEKLMLRAAVGANQEVKRLVVVQPRSILTPPETEPAARFEAINQDRPVSPLAGRVISKPTDPEPTEYASPAFLKRARLSYGALFEGDDDALDEDGGTKGRGRKRTKFGRNPSEWRYASQSRSPSPVLQHATPSRTAEAAVEVNMEQSVPSKPQTSDEGVQTMEVDMSPRPAQQRGPPEEPPQAKLVNTEAPPRESSPPKEPPKMSAPSPKHAVTSTGTDEKARPRSPATVKATQSSLPTAETKKASRLPAKAVGNATNTANHSNLFGNIASNRNDYDMPRFGRPIHNPVDGSFGLADQVRFGFSHVPQTDRPAQPTAPQVRIPQPGTEGVPAATPVAHLAQTLKEPSPGPKYQEMDSYIGPAEQEMEDESRNPFAMATEVPAVETFGDSDQWAMATEDPSYNQVEGGHYGIDALEEGRRITGDESAIRSDEIDVDKVPPGFSSYGAENLDEIASESEDSEHDVDQSYIPGEDFLENEELEDELDDDVALKDNDHQEYNSEGEVIEEGDYDQRIYNEPETDSDGLEDDKFMVEDEVYARDNHPDVIDEDEMRNAIANPDGEMGETIQSEDEDYDMDEEEDAGEMGDDETADGYDDEDGEGYHDGKGERHDDGDGGEQVEEDDYDEYDDEDEDEGSLEESRASSQSQASYAHQQAHSRMPSQASKQPEVIDLISDSEEEEEDDDEGPIGVTYATLPPSTSNHSPSDRNDQAVDKQELKVRDGEIDPVLLEAVASDQGALDEEMARGAKEAAMEEEMEADLEQAYERQVHGEQHLHSHEYGQAQEERTVTGDITLPKGVPSVIDALNRQTAAPSGGENDAVNAKKPEEATAGSPERHTSFVDGAGSSPPKTASRAEDDEATDSLASSAARHNDTEAGPSTEDAVKSARPNNTEQHVASPQRSNLITDDDELVVDTVKAVAQLTDEMSDQAASNGPDTKQSSEAEDQDVDVIMEDQVRLLPDDEVITEGGSADRDMRPEQFFGSDGQQAGAAPSVPPASQPFDSRGQAELAYDHTRRAEDAPSTPLETQDSEVFMSQAESLPSSPQGDDMETAPQQGGLQEDKGNISQADEDIDNSGDEDQDLSMDDPEELEVEDDNTESPDIDAQVEAQLRVEIEQTTVIEEVVEVVRDAVADIEDSKDDNVRDDVVRQEMRNIIPEDLRGLISQDLDQEEAVLDDNVTSEDVGQEEAPQDAEIGDAQVQHLSHHKLDTELVVETPVKPFKDTGTGHAAEELPIAQSKEPLGKPVTEAPGTNVEVVVKSRETPGKDEDKGAAEEQTTAATAEASHDTGDADAPSTNVEVVPETNSRAKTRSQKAQEQNAKGQASEAEAGLDTGTQREVSRPAKDSVASNKRTKSSRTKEKEPVDLSVELARATLHKRGRNKKQADATAPDTTHWHHTRQHSPPGRCSLTPMVDEIIEQDSSVALARAALNSPSNKASPNLRTSDPKELTRRLRTGLSEYTPLKTVRTSKSRPDHFDVLAIVVSPGADPQRTKSREYVMTIHVTDPSISPNHVIEVQLSAGHRAYLPIGIQAGQGVMLRKFTTLETSGKDHYGLKATEESSWAVFSDDDEILPDIKPPPVSEETEIEGTVMEYMCDLQAWFSGLDEAAREKIAKAASA